jgi:NADH-quinone oxidoreductase subunit L
MPPAGKHVPNWGMMAVSTLLALGGIGLAYVFYVLRPEMPGQAAKAAPWLYQLSKNKFYIDEAYAALIVRPAEALASLLGGFDRNGVDAAANAVGHAPRLVGNLFRPMQNGLVQFYALAMVLGLAVFLLALARSL